jgi:hypothetical protein
MAIDAPVAPAPAGDFWNRLRRARFVLIAGAIVFAALVALGPLTPIEGLIAFAAIAVASLIGSVDDSEVGGVPRAREAMAQLAIDRVIDAAISGLPDPVIVLVTRYRG